MKSKDLIPLIPLVCALAAGLDQPALAGENAGTSPAANRSDSTKFVRLARDSRGQPQAMETAIVRYAAAAEGKHHGVAVDLIGAVHVGEKEYYARLEREFDHYEVVLYELVSPADRPAAPKAAGRAIPPAEPAFSAISMLQQGMKDFLQLEHQLEHINYQRTNFVHADMTVQEFKETMARRGESFFSMFLSLMIKTMAEQNQATVRVSDWEILSALFSPDRALMMKRLMAEQFDQLEAAINDLSGPDGSTILTERNKVALGVLAREIANGRKRIAIFYGAAHMPDLEARLAQEFGMRRDSERWLAAWDLRTRAQRAEKIGAPETKNPFEREAAER